MVVMLPVVEFFLGGEGVLYWFEQGCPSKPRELWCVTPRIFEKVPGRWPSM